MTSEEDEFGVTKRQMEAAFIVAGCVLAAVFIIGAVVVMNWLGGPK